MGPPASGLPHHLTQQSHNKGCISARADFTASFKDQCQEVVVNFSEEIQAVLEISSSLISAKET